MSLRARLAAEIATAGAMDVATYMTRCLHDPAEGYYATRPALGAGGDFITAPMLSQMFGEILCAWAHEVWSRLGSPRRFRLVELGPGDGTLMRDIQRCAAADPAFQSARETWLVETSAPLRAVQRGGVQDATWVDTLAEVPDDLPVVILANEFLDCLPIRQWVLREDGWRERRVGLETDETLAWVEVATEGAPVTGAAPGEIWETSPALVEMGKAVGERLRTGVGAALFIDYGSDEPGPGDTLQALRGHHKEPALLNPGAADLTAHVDFAAFVAAARRAGAWAAPIETQGGFLRRMGLDHRSATLMRASPDKAAVIARQVARLASTEGMGALFKVAALSSPGLVTP